MNEKYHCGRKYGLNRFEAWIVAYPWQWYIACILAGWFLWDFVEWIRYI